MEFQKTRNCVEIPRPRVDVGVCSASVIISASALESVITPSCSVLKAHGSIYTGRGAYIRNDVRVSEHDAELTHTGLIFGWVGGLIFGERRGLCSMGGGSLYSVEGELMLPAHLKILNFKINNLIGLFFFSI